jgi:uncharacterized membrane protein (GlpM family)
MSDAAVVLVKAATGGVFVVAFALLGQGLRPKAFAGLFAAAPSIALASMIITVTDNGRHDAAEAALGMMVGAVAFVVFAVLVRPLLARMHAVGASSIAVSAWLLVAVGGYLAFLR